MSIPKPQLRGLLQAQTKTRFLYGTVLGFASAAYLGIFMREKTGRATMEYFKKTDMQELFRKQKKNGVYQYEDFWKDEE